MEKQRLLQKRPRIPVCLPNRLSQGALRGPVQRRLCEQRPARPKAFPVYVHTFMQPVFTRWFLGGGGIRAGPAKSFQWRAGRSGEIPGNPREHIQEEQRDPRGILGHPSNARKEGGLERTLGVGRPARKCP